MWHGGKHIESSHFSSQLLLIFLPPPCCKRGSMETRRMAAWSFSTLPLPHAPSSAPTLFLCQSRRGKEHLRLAHYQARRGSIWHMLLHALGGLRLVLLLWNKNKSGSDTFWNLYTIIYLLLFITHLLLFWRVCQYFQPLVCIFPSWFSWVD